MQRRDLEPAAALRVCLPAAASLLPLCDWPEDLAQKVNGGTHLVQGGHEFDGREPDAAGRTRGARRRPRHPRLGRADRRSAACSRR